MIKEWLQTGEEAGGCVVDWGWPDILLCSTDPSLPCRLSTVRVKFPLLVLLSAVCL